MEVNFLSNPDTNDAITDIAGNRKLMLTSSWSLAPHGIRRQVRYRRVGNGRSFQGIIVEKTGI